VVKAPGNHIKLSPPEREHILDGEYRLVRHVTEVPAAVRWTFGGSHFEMADPGDAYQATDAENIWETLQRLVRRKSLPRRRLILAGCSPAKCFLHYETGGPGHSYSVVVFAMDTTGVATFLWAGAGFSCAADIAELRSKIRSGEFRDDRPYSW